MYRFDVGKRPDLHGKTRAFYEVNVKQGEKILASEREWHLIFPTSNNINPESNINVIRILQMIASTIREVLKEL